MHGLPVPVDLDRAFSRLLDTRAAAVMSHDRAAFLASLDRSDPAFVSEQQALFTNLAQLPFQTYAIHIVPASLTRVSGGYEVAVEVSQQLTGYDAAPVTRPERYLLRATGHRGRFLLAGTADRAFEQQLGVLPPPWELEPIRVRSAGGVLGVFDAATVRRAPAILRSVTEGATEVGSVVPYPWQRRVVVYALGSRSYLDALVDGSTAGSGSTGGRGAGGGGVAADVDGVAVQIPASSADPEVATTRVVLSPDVVTAPRLARDRLVRHELTHLAVGVRDDTAPTWLREGLAEWVSVQGLRVDQQTIAPPALAAARGPHVRLPGDDGFDDDQAAAHYGLAWFACVALADEDGPGAPWRLLGRYDDLERTIRHPAPAGAVAVRERQEQATMRRALRTFGLTPDRLARRAARLLVRQAAATETAGPPR